MGGDPSGHGPPAEEWAVFHTATSAVWSAGGRGEGEGEGEKENVAFIMATTTNCVLPQIIVTFVPHCFGICTYIQDVVCVCVCVCVICTCSIQN